MEIYYKCTVNLGWNGGIPDHQGNLKYQEEEIILNQNGYDQWCTTNAMVTLVCVCDLDGNCVDQGGH